jgi:hypothetical protein
VVTREPAIFAAPAPTLALVGASNIGRLRSWSVMQSMINYW